MNQLNQNRIRKLSIPGAFFFWALLTFSVYSMEAQVLLTPPGLRPVKDPVLVIPAGYRYPNQPITLPAYRDVSGKPAGGWSDKFVDTRRFASDQSAWIYFRNSYLQQSVSVEREGANRSLHFWPVGTIMVIESYKGNAFHKKNDALMEIAVMSKIMGDRSDLKNRILVQDRGGAEFQPGGILEYFEDLRPTKRIGSDGPSRNAGKRGTNKDIGPKGIFEIASIDSSAQTFYPVNWTYARFNPDRSPSINSVKVRECHQCHSIAFHLTGDLIFTQFP